MDPNFKDFLRRILAVVIYMTGLFYLMLWSMPYTHVPAQLVHAISAGNPIIGILLSGACFAGVLWIAANPKLWIEGGIEFVYRGVRLVF